MPLTLVGAGGSSARCDRTLRCREGVLGADADADDSDDDEEDDEFGVDGGGGVELRACNDVLDEPVDDGSTGVCCD